MGHALTGIQIVPLTAARTFWIAANVATGLRRGYLRKEEMNVASSFHWGSARSSLKLSARQFLFHSKLPTGGMFQMRSVQPHSNPNPLDISAPKRTEPQDKE
ncbi:MAG: hypothetical protein ACU0DI_13150 [Paracoccaceae bacterium]